MTTWIFPLKSYCIVSISFQSNSIYFYWIWPIIDKIWPNMIEMLIKRLKWLNLIVKVKINWLFDQFQLKLIYFDRFWTFGSNPDLNSSNSSRWLKIRLQIWMKYLIKIQFLFDYNRNTIPKSIQLPKLKKTSFKHNIGTNGLKAWEQLSSIRGVFVNQGPGEPQVS